ncbi:MAG: SelT/SelW/SelH family protein [Rhodospirillaceae bacterium]|nr:Rdx family protein [Rhodospirillaceae bacterium]MXW91216.1 SelT/SelW/SelH family protein [Rhodospirillaceae bacterium]MYB14531.1 SelT/SelW/SelH family protein [Rhodospirillaceae bacterium]MYI48538.1 SelT/SelW/SelH family protein [Rhodospirillaceae bacterium]
MSDRFSEIDGAEIELVKGGGGVFEISLDGELVFSKKALGRFPEDEEIEAIAAQA